MCCSESFLGCLYKTSFVVTSLTIIIYLRHVYRYVLILLLLLIIRIHFFIIMLIHSIQQSHSTTIIKLPACATYSQCKVITSTRDYNMGRFSPFSLRTSVCHQSRISINTQTQCNKLGNPSVCVFVQAKKPTHAHTQALTYLYFYF